MNIALRFGSLAAGIISFWNILNYLWFYKTSLSKISFFVNVIVLLIVLYKGIVAIKKSEFDNKITFGNAALSGIKITIVSAVLLSIITFGYSSIPNKNYKSYIESQTEKVMKERKMPDIDKTLNELRLSFDPVRQAQSALIFTTAIGIVFSFVFAMIIRNKVHEPEPII
jgi:hypothetical protein